MCDIEEGVVVSRPREQELEHAYRGEHPVRTLRYLFENQRGRLLIALFFFALKYSPAWALPVLTADIIDVIVAGGPLERVWLNSALMAFLIAQNLPTHVLHVHFLSKAVRQVEVRLRSAAAERLQMMSMGFYSRTPAAVLQTKVVRDVENIELMMRNVTEGGLSALFGLLGALVTTAVRVPVFLPFFLVMVPLSGLIIVKLRRDVAERNEEFRESVESMSSRVSEMTTLLPMTRAHGMEKEALERVQESFADVRRAGLRLDRFNARYNASAWVAFQLSNLACLTVAGWASLTGVLEISTGEIVLLTAYFGMLTGSIVLLASLMPSIAKGFESVRSLGEIFEAPDIEENSGKTRIKAVSGAIDFDHVTFTYPSASDPAINEVTFSVAPGSIIAVVGESGSGKSTLLNLIVGFVRPTSGRVSVDGVDMSGIDLRTYRRFVSVVPQESVLFSGTVRDNVTFGLTGLTDVDVWQALEQASAAEFVRALPEGLDSLLGTGGTRLSGGQRQRLAIARAVVRDPRILILDEATSSLDSVSERAVADALQRLMQGRTSFVVAHRMSTVQRATHILVLDSGRVVESGTHHDLMSLGGLYSRLAQAHTPA